MIERRIIMLDRLRERVVGEVTQRDVTVFGTRHKKSFTTTLIDVQNK